MAQPSAVGAERLDELPRYLQAAGRRLDKAALDPEHDAVLAARVLDVEAERRRQLALLPADAVAARAELEQLRWAVEELRVSLFAQDLGVRGPVSEQRLLRALSALAA